MSNKNLYPINVSSLNEEEDGINNTLIQEFVKLNQKCDDVILKIRKRKSKKNAA